MGARWVSQYSVIGHSHNMRVDATDARDKIIKVAWSLRNEGKETKKNTYREASGKTSNVNLELFRIITENQKRFSQIQITLN